MRHALRQKLPRFRRMFQFFIYGFIKPFSHNSSEKSSAKSEKESAAHSSHTLLRGGNPNPAVLKKISRGKANPFLPQNCFALPRPHFAPPTARILGGQNPERKTPFPFSKEISPPPNQKCKECFFFRGFRRVREAGAGRSSSVRFNPKLPRAPRVPHSGFCWK